MAYSTLPGIERVLRGMSQKTSLPDETDFAMNLLRTQFDHISAEFFEFFPDLINYVEKKFLPSGLSTKRKPCLNTSAQHFQTAGVQTRKINRSG
jgi:hypothetical protein